MVILHHVTDPTGTFFESALQVIRDSYMPQQPEPESPSTPLAPLVPPEPQQSEAFRQSLEKHKQHILNAPCFFDDIAFFPPPKKQKKHKKEKKNPYIDEEAECDDD